MPTIGAYANTFGFRPGVGESSPAACGSVEEFIALARSESAAPHGVVAITDYTTILAVRAILERRAVTDVVEEARRAKTPAAGILRYELAGDEFRLLGLTRPPIA